MSTESRRAVRHRRLVIADQEPLCPASALLSPEPSLDRLQEDVWAEARRQRRGEILVTT